MECGQRKLDVAKVSIAFPQGFPAGLANPIFARYAHASIQGAMNLYRAILCQVEKVPVADFKDSLIDDVLARPSGLSAKKHSMFAIDIRNAESQLFYALGHRIHHLLLRRVHCRWRLHHVDGYRVWARTSVFDGQGAALTDDEYCGSHTTKIQSHR